MQSTPSKFNIINPKVHSFIDNMIVHLKTDRMMFQAGAVSDDTMEHYRKITHEDPNVLPSYAKETASIYFLRGMFADLIGEIKKMEKRPHSLALHIGPSKLHLWAVVPDDSIDVENALFLAEAKINAKYETYHCEVSIIIIEESDMISTPQQYNPIPDEIIK